MDIADCADIPIERERAYSVRSVLASLLPDRPQVVVAGEDGAPLIICYDCEDPIPMERLAARPYAIRCVDCQAAFETAF